MAFIAYDLPLMFVTMLPPCRIPALSVVTPGVLPAGVLKDDLIAWCWFGPLSIWGEPTVLTVLLRMAGVYSAGLCL
jgi:hypothetical protein